MYVNKTYSPHGGVLNGCKCNNDIKMTTYSGLTDMADLRSELEIHASHLSFSGPAVADVYNTS